jgi:hypothetical protein
MGNRERHRRESLDLDSRLFQGPWWMLREMRDELCAIGIEFADRTIEFALLNTR